MGFSLPKQHINQISFKSVMVELNALRWNDPLVSFRICTHLQNHKLSVYGFINVYEFVNLRDRKNEWNMDIIFSSWPQNLLKQNGMLRLYDSLQ